MLHRRGNLVAKGERLVVTEIRRECLGFIEIGRIAVGSFGIFSHDGLKNILLENAADFAILGSLEQLFGHRIWTIWSGSNRLPPWEDRRLPPLTRPHNPSRECASADGEIPRVSLPPQTLVRTTAYASLARARNDGMDPRPLFNGLVMGQRCKATS